MTTVISPGFPSGLVVRGKDMTPILVHLDPYTVLY